MQRKLSAKPVYHSGKNKTDREFIYLHMSNHYRRIVNAKKAIDNSPPSCFKGKRPCTSNPGIPKNKVNRHFESLLLTDRSLSTNSNKDSWGTDSFTCGSRYHARCVPDSSPNMSSPKLGDMDLIERITYDTKHGPSSYSEKCWSKPKEHNEKRIVLKENKSEVKHSAGKRSLSNAGHSERTQKRKLSSQPKTANSRSFCKCTKLCLCDESGCVNESASKKMTLNPKEHSVTSSRDSAYNGGISSVPESRSPTPDHRSKKDCCCCCCERMQRASLLFPKERSNTTTPRATTPRATTPRATTPRCRTPRSRSPRARSSRARSITPKSEVRPKSATVTAQVIELKSSTGLKSAMCPKSAKVLKMTIKSPINSGSDTSLTKSRTKSPEPPDPYEKMQDDALYVSFVQDITTEVLEKNLYTNRALKNVMKKHLQKNLKRLDKDRMLQELEHLRMQLGIPEDQSIFDSATETVDSSSDLTKCNYPIISDSEFSFPADDTIPPENPELPEKTKSPEKAKSPEKTKTPESKKPLEKKKSLDKAKILERSKSPEKAKPKTSEVTKVAEQPTTCIYIKTSGDPTLAQTARLKGTKEQPVCVQAKAACRQACAQMSPCFQSQSSCHGPGICFLQSSGETTPCFMQQSPGQATPSFMPQSSGPALLLVSQSSGQNTPSFMQQSSGQTTPSFVQQSPGQNTPSFMQQSSSQMTPSFMQNSSGQMTPTFIPHSSGQATPSYVQHSSSQATPSFVQHSSGQATPSFVQHSSGQATPSYVQHSSGQATPSFVQHSGQGTPSFVQHSGQGTPSYVQHSGQGTPSYVQHSGQATPSFVQHSSGQATPTFIHTHTSGRTPSFTPQSSIIVTPSFLPQKSRQTKSANQVPPKQTKLTFQSPSVHAKSCNQASYPSNHPKPSCQTPTSILSKQSTQVAHTNLAKQSTQVVPSVSAKPSAHAVPSGHAKPAVQQAPSILSKPSSQRVSVTQPPPVTVPSFLPPTTVQTKIFLKQTTSRKQTVIHPEQVSAAESRGKTTISTERIRIKGEKSITVMETCKNSSETDNEISGIPRKKSPRERRKEDSILKSSSTRSRDMSSEDSDRPSEPKKRSFGKGRRHKLPKRYTISSSESELSGCYSRTLVKENRKVSISKDTYSGGSSTPTHVRKKSRSVSFWRNPEYKSYHGPKIKTRKTVVSHSEESFVVGRKKSPKCE